MLYGTVTEFCTRQEVGVVRIHGCYLTLRNPMFSVPSCPLVPGTLDFLPTISILLTPSIWGSRYEYLWEDGSKYKRPTKLPAPDYVDALMNWVQNLLEDEAVFPNKIGVFRLKPREAGVLNVGFRCTVPKRI